MRRRLHPLLLLSLGVLLSAAPPQPATDAPLIRRTEYGVPHITATNFRGIGIGLGYAQTEDYGIRVVLGLLRDKGWMGRTFGKDSVGSDFAALLVQERVQETYHLLDADTRAMYEGFAEGVNRFIRTHRSTLPTWAQPVFTGHDIAAGDIGTANITTAQRLVLRRLQRDSLGRGGGRDTTHESTPAYNEDGSNAWALAPSRTTSGRAILLRNPHLAWTAGYWEAHVTVPGKLDFYGDFRIGSAFAVVAGFNKDLGWATTNNAPDLDEVYALELDTSRADHYRFDGTAVPLRQRRIMVEYSTPSGMMSESRTVWSTPLGPVVHRTPEHVYVVRAGPDGEYRAGAQFLAMMRARNLAEWKAALAMRARATSNLTYADRAGNILTIWMASLPKIPHAPTGDSLFTIARTSADIWTSLVPLDQLPQTVNPKGGYVHNENDAPYYANLNAVLDSGAYPANVERGELRLRSQHALQLLHGTKKFSLEGVVAAKHSMRMLLADRVKANLIAVIRRAPRTPSLDSAARILSAWDNSVAPTSRGGLLFETWWRRYTSIARDSSFAERWSLAKLTSTPRGLGKPDVAIDAMTWAMQDMHARYGDAAIAWGDVHRVQRGAVDVPVGGCSGALGCFRVLAFEQKANGTRVANSGDGWVLAVEFGAQRPRAYSVLSYGQSADSSSPHFADQAAMFAKGVFKPVWWTNADVQRHTLREYRP